MRWVNDPSLISGNGRPAGHPSVSFWEMSVYICGHLISCLGSWSIAYGLPQIHGCHPCQVANTNLCTILKAASSDAPCVVGPVSLGVCFLFGNLTSWTRIALTFQSFHVCIPSSVTSPPPKRKQNKKWAHFVWSVYWLKRVQAPKGGWVFFCLQRDRSHQLRRAVRWGAMWR